VDLEEFLGEGFVVFFGSHPLVVLPSARLLWGWHGSLSVGSSWQIWLASSFVALLFFLSRSRLAIFCRVWLTVWLLSALSIFLSPST
jgi:hypothetical protein